MTDTDLQGDQGNYTSLILAQMRVTNRKLDVIFDTLQQHGDRFVRLERDMAEGFARVERDISSLRDDISGLRDDGSNLRDDVRGLRRDIHEVKSDMTLTENKILTVQSEILSVVLRLNDLADAKSAGQDTPEPDGS